MADILRGKGKTWSRDHRYRGGRLLHLMHGQPALLRAGKALARVAGPEERPEGVSRGPLCGSARILGASVVRRRRTTRPFPSTRRVGSGLA